MSTALFASPPTELFLFKEAASIVTHFMTTPCGIFKFAIFVECLSKQLYTRSNFGWGTESVSMCLQLSIKTDNLLKIFPKAIHCHLNLRNELTYKIPSHFIYDHLAWSFTKNTGRVYERSTQGFICINLTIYWQIYFFMILTNPMYD